MKKLYIYIIGIALTLTGCESVVDGLNKNPNSIEIDDIDAGLYVNTPELALVGVLRGLDGRMASLWTGQIVGVNQFPLAYYNYQLTESTFGFGGYQSVVTQCKHIQQAAPDNGLYQGLTRVLEAYLFTYFASYAYNYDAYTSDDFDAGGLLNADGLQPLRALLREIILERYVSGYTEFIPWDDARRLRGAGESDIAVPIPLNTPTATAHPERFYYPETEMLANPNAPEDPGLYAPTEVNR